MRNKSQPELFHELIILHCDLYFVDRPEFQVDQR